MESWLHAGVETSRWLQQHYPQMRGLMELISDLGRFEFYLAVLPLIYWCLDKRLGRDLAYLLALSELANRMLKHALRGPRPFWLDGVLAARPEEGYGVPSGHVQSAAIFYLGLSLWLRRGWIWLVAAVLIFLMGLSRVYVGNHFPHDAAAGLLLGALFIAAYAAWRRQPAGSHDRRGLAQTLVALPVILMAVYALTLLLIPAPPASARWSQPLAPLEATSLEDVASAFGLLLGLTVGLLREQADLRFSVAGSLGRKAARYFLGMAVTLLLWRGLGAAFAVVEPLWPALALRALRYALLGLWVAYFAPLVFARLGLLTAERGASPVVEVS